MVSKKDILKCGDYIEKHSLCCIKCGKRVYRYQMYSFTKRKNKYVVVHDICLNSREISK